MIIDITEAPIAPAYLAFLRILPPSILMVTVSIISLNDFLNLLNAEIVFDKFTLLILSLAICNELLNQSEILLASSSGLLKISITLSRTFSAATTIPGFVSFPPPSFDLKGLDKTEANDSKNVLILFKNGIISMPVSFSIFAASSVIKFPILSIAEET